MTLARAINKFEHGESGSILVEFAASATLLCTIIFAIMDFSRALYIDHFVSNAATEAARYASLRGSTYTASCPSPASFSCAATSSNVTSFVRSIAPAGVSNSPLVVTTTWSGKTPSGATCRAATGSNSPGCVVQVKVTYNFAFVLPFLLSNTLALNSTAAYAISQ